MSDERIKNTEEEIPLAENQEYSVEKESIGRTERRRFLNKRNGFVALTFLVFAFVFLGAVAVFAYKFGFIDRYIEEEFRVAFSDMGIDFEAEVFHVSPFPFQIIFEKASFDNKKNGQKIFRINSARFGLKMTDLFALKFERNIDVETTNINQLQAWVLFDGNGVSNFDGVVNTPAKAIKFNFATDDLAIRDSIIHFNEKSRKISGEAKNVQFYLTPIESRSLEEFLQYKFDFSSTDASFTYNKSKLDPINIKASGIATNKKTEVGELKLTSPLGESILVGAIRDYESFDYDFEIKSSLDLTQTSQTFPLGTAITGQGNFIGKVTGSGENYKIVGEAKSENLAAANVRLKALKVNATIDGEGSMYKGNGKAIAELLTFEDFRLEFPQLIGNIRGTGTDFKWLGELHAAAAKSPVGTIGGLYLNDAIAEYRDNYLLATIGTFRARKFSNNAVNLESIQSRNIKIVTKDGVTDAIIPNVTASKLDIEGATLEGIAVSDAKVKNQNGETKVTAGNVQTRNLETEAAKLGDVTAKDVQVNNRNGATSVKTSSIRAGTVETRGADLGDVTAKDITMNRQGGVTNIRSKSIQAGTVKAGETDLSNVTANDVNINQSNGLTKISARNVESAGINTNETTVGNVNASNVNIQYDGDTTNIDSDNLRIAKVQTKAAILGNLNIAGVRLTVRQGKIEGTSDDFNAGDVIVTKASGIENGGKLNNVAVYKPVFVLESSGRYRASLDLTLGSGVLGSVTLGKAKASVVAENDQIEFNSLSAEVMDGKLDGNVTLALNDSKLSKIKAEFINLSIGKLLALQGGRVIPVDGNTTGNADLSFPGTNFKKASGTLNADIQAKAGNDGDDDVLPLTGKVAVTALNGLFDVDYANLHSEKSSLNATGRFDLSGDDSDLNIAVNSSEAGEIIKIIKILNFSPSIEEQLDKYQANFAGNFVFNGNIKGNLSDPFLDGRASLDSIILRGKTLGSLTTKIYASPSGFELSDGHLTENGGGNIVFDVKAPRGGTNNISVQAKLNNISLGNFLSALPINSLPNGLKNLSAQASGTVDLRGLPNEMQGEANIFAKDGSVNGQTFDTLETRAIFEGTLINLETFNAKFGNGKLVGEGFYKTDSTEFDFDVKGNDIPIERILAFFPKNESLEIDGTINVTAKLTGKSNDAETFDVNFKGSGQNVVINDNEFGKLNFVGKTQDQVLHSELVAEIQGQPLLGTSTIDFSDPNLPLKGESRFDQIKLDPLIAIFRKPTKNSVALGGVATGKVFFEGNLSQTDAKGEREFTKDNLNGTANFSQFELMVDQTPLIATNPINLKFDVNAIEFVNEARFSGGGTNLVVSGAKAFTDKALNNLAVDGKINLKILNALSENVFFSGLANVAVRLTGSNKTARLNGAGQLQNGSVSTFMGSQRISFERLNGNIIFATNQAQIEDVTGFLGGGKLQASGGVLLDGLTIQQYRIDVRGRNVTAPLPKDFITTGNAEIQINGRKNGDVIDTYIQGQFIATRSVYRKDIELRELVSGRSTTTLTTGSGASDSSVLGTTNLDVRIIGRNAFVVRNNLADLTASADLRVTGNTDFPEVSGRITSDSGSLFFNDNRYNIQRGVLTFPPNNDGLNPVVNLQAETDIKGYQIFVNLNGKLSDADVLQFAAHSNPSLPQQDVVSLITTGNLSDSDSGIYGQGGVNTAAGVLTDEIINRPLSRATDKLFGLNKFELDPIVSGSRGNPTARLTVGRQINKNLLVTYSTNLSEDQNQVLAVEYQVSNRISFVAQYEQRSLSNVTQDRNSFSFEIRLRKRF